MREKYESLALAQLKELAKVRGLKGTSTMKKAEIVEAMLAEDERQKSLAAASSAPQSPAQSMPQSTAQTAAQNQAQNQGVSKGNVAVAPQGSYQQEQASPQAVRNETRYTTRGDAQAEARTEAYTKTESKERNYRANEVYDENQYPKELDSGVEASGILEVMPDGYGFIRCENYLPGENDVYVAPSQIRRFGLKTGDILRGNKRIKTQQEKFSALLFIRTINGYTVEEALKRKAFEDMTPIFPDERIKLETPGCSVAMRVMDLVSPVGKGQRGMIVSPPKAGKTTLLKEVAKSILRTNPQMHMLILLIDERPEEVTDIREAIVGENVEVIYSTFDELPEHHKRVSEMVIERAKRLVEHKKDVVILLDSITRLTRAYNQVVPPSGRTLSGGLDPSALHMPKRFFGAARNMREGGSLTILATALVDTGSKMDDVVYEEFKGTGNMEMVLDRKLSEKRIFPAIDLQKSGTRREDLLLSSEELEAINIMRKALNGMKADEATDRILDMFARTRTNVEFVNMVKKNRFI
ncbi:MAG: transcription termination factor Rho [Lachnospiraceae bacterium]|nr:transcription termination factor Rho [Lachnospiraceae bacterium]